VGSKSRDVACISSAFSLVGRPEELEILASWSEGEAREAVDRVIARADKPTIGRYRLRLEFFGPDSDPEPEQEL